jgi:hypothetical protein
MEIIMTFVSIDAHAGNASQGLDDVGVGQAIIFSVQYGF